MVSAGSGELNSVLQERWISNIKYYNRTAFKIEGIDLECFVSNFLEKSNINLKHLDLAHPLDTGDPGGIKPVWGQLEIQLTMRAQHKAVNRIVVLHKALELVPNFMGGLLDPEFSRRAMRWYYRFIKRRQYNLSIQRPSSVGQVLQNEILLAIRSKKKDIADEISCLNGAREVSTEDVRNWMSSKRHAAGKAVPE